MPKDSLRFTPKAFHKNAKPKHSGKDPPIRQIGVSRGLSVLTGKDKERKRVRTSPGFYIFFLILGSQCGLSALVATVSNH